MNAHLLSTIEKLLPRLTSAGMVFVLAYFSSPFVVGLYSATMLAYTLVQATAETAVRQVLPSVAYNERFLRRYLLFALGVGGAFLFIVSVCITVGAWRREGGETLWLLPVVCVPALNAIALPAIGKLQLAGAWAILARSQAIGVTCAAAVSVATMLLVSPLAGAGLFLPVAEGVNAVLVRVATRGAVRQPVDAERNSFRELMGMGTLGSASWLQGQGDRVLLSLLAGPAALGTLSVGSAMARAIGDPISSASSSLLRVELEPSKGTADLAQTFRNVIFKSLLLGTCAAIAVDLGSAFVAQPILGSKWSATIALVPVLAVAIPFSIMNASLGVMQIYLRKLGRAIVIPVVALAAAPLVAIVATHDLYLAAWLIVAREAVVNIMAFLVIRKSVRTNIQAYAFGSALLIAAIAVLFR